MEKKAKTNWHPFHLAWIAVALCTNSMIFNFPRSFSVPYKTGRRERKKERAFDAKRRNRHDNSVQVFIFEPYQRVKSESSTRRNRFAFRVKKKKNPKNPDYCFTHFLLFIFPIEEMREHERSFHGSR